MQPTKVCLFIPTPKNLGESRHTSSNLLGASFRMLLDLHLRELAIRRFCQPLENFVKICLGHVPPQGDLHHALRIAQEEASHFSCSSASDCCSWTYTDVPFGVKPPGVNVGSR